MEDLANLIRSIPDFPKKGILFRDITTLLKHGEGFRKAIKTFVSRYKDADIDKVACIEARGFLLGAPVAYELGCGVVPIRKPGKLPHETIRATYQLEYGMDAVEIHKDAIEQGEKVLIIDDLLATGGTARAAAELVERLGGTIVAIAFLIELGDLNGRDLLDKYEVFSVINYR